MKLVASLMVGPGEFDRYLLPCVDHLLAFCDEVRVRYEDDNHVDSPRDQADAVEAWRYRWPERVEVKAVAPSFFQHEGRARQELLDWTLKANPTHILAIDADEFICDGQLLRETLRLERNKALWGLCMMEVWGATQEALTIRQDGGWVEHDVSIAYAPGRLRAPLLLPDKALACGRIPVTQGVRAGHSGTGILHMGWANREKRQARYQRYVTHDGGKFHAGSHIKSIMWADGRVKTNEWEWPEALLPYRTRILEGVTRV